MVSDEIINTLISKILINIEFSNRLVFDGYPRNVEQAKSLNQLMKNNNQVISCVINLKANKDSIVKRILDMLPWSEWKKFRIGTGQGGQHLI